MREIELEEISRAKEGTMSTGYQYPKLKVESPNVKYSVDEQGKGQLESLYEYEHVRVLREPDAIKVSRMGLLDRGGGGSSCGSLLQLGG